MIVLRQVYEFVYTIDVRSVFTPKWSRSMVKFGNLSRKSGQKIKDSI